MDRFRDRQDAGTILAEHLKEYAHQSNVIVLALPRGGVPVAYEVAIALSLPLDIFIVRKLGVPGYEELAMGALAMGGTIILNEPLIHQLQLDQASINAVLESEQKELVRREHLYRGHHPFPDLLGKTIILVDDGIATGSTMLAAIKALRKYKPAFIIVAVPVAARQTCEEMSNLVDQIICPLKPINFHAVGLWYQNFSQTSDSEVIELLEKANLTRKISG
jgi:putative phosphoribosyl transferase